MRAQIQPLHPLLVGAEGIDEKTVGILILRNEFLRRAFIIDAISGANSAVAVDAIGEIQGCRSRLVDERSEKDNHSLPTNSLHGRNGAIFVFLNGFDRYVDLVGGLIFLARDLPGCPRRSRVFQPLRFSLLLLAFLQRGARFFLFAFCLLPLTLFLLLLRLATTLRHAIDRGRRLRVAIRRPATLILQLLTIRLVALQQLALRILKPDVPRRGTLEADRHHDAKRCIGKLDMFRRRKRLRLLNEEERRPAEFRVHGYDAGSRKHPPGAAHVEFESHNAAPAAGSSPGQIAFVMLEIRDDLVLPLQRHGNINLTRIAGERKFGACEYRSRCEEKNTEQSRLQHLQPKPKDDVARPRTLLRRRSSTAFSAATRPLARTARATGQKQHEHRRR